MVVTPFGDLDYGGANGTRVSTRGASINIGVQPLSILVNCTLAGADTVTMRSITDIRETG